MGLAQREALNPSREAFEGDKRGHATEHLDRNGWKVPGMLASLCYSTSDSRYQARPAL